MALRRDMCVSYLLYRPCYFLGVSVNWIATPRDHGSIPLRKSPIAFMLRSFPQAPFCCYSFSLWSRHLVRICPLLLAVTLAGLLLPGASGQVTDHAQPAQSFAEKNLAPGSDNSIWTEFAYNAASWREDSEAAQSPSRVCAGPGTPSLSLAVYGTPSAEPCLLLPRDGQPAASAAGGSDNSPDGPNAAAGNSRAQRPSGKFLQPVATQKQSDSVEWGHLLWDSTKFLMFLHAYRLANEKETREGLSGPFFKGYADAVANIHGWNDGDPFETNYINHPMEGGVAGFLWVAHDPRYRQAEFGRSSEYWKSRLRAMAYAAAFSLQFEIGPLSEASIGNVQNAAPGKAGVVDWVITPTVGFLWMVGEDAMDQYLVKKLEVHTDSHFKRLVIRSALNPTRSLANMMQGKPPWNRDTRPGITEY
jgi:hypothetical protein